MYDYIRAYIYVYSNICIYTYLHYSDLVLRTERDDSFSRSSAVNAGSSATEARRGSSVFARFVVSITASSRTKTHITTTTSANPARPPITISMSDGYRDTHTQSRVHRAAVQAKNPSLLKTLEFYPATI